MKNTIKKGQDYRFVYVKTVLAVHEMVSIYRTALEISKDPILKRS